MKLNYFLITFLFYPFISLHSQTLTINGYLTDSETGEKLNSVNIWEAQSQKGTITNEFGYYSITLPKDSVKLTYSFIGYQPLEITFLGQRDTTISINLTPTLNFEAIEVTATTQDRIEQTTQMSTITIPIEQINTLPAILGEADILKTLQLLPGVQSGTEGQSGLNVRGGSPDQNLILLDGVPVYNASHLFGFFSVFNTDAIKKVTLIKGGFPAQYGGRLSSVVDIDMKEGNLKEWKGTASLGIVGSKITIEGPLKKDKTAMIISARRSFFDVLLRPFASRFQNQGEGIDNDINYFFYDFNAKINHTFSEKDRLFFSVYMGKDSYKNDLTATYDSSAFTINDGLEWGNITAALRWNHLWNKRLFSNTTLTFSRYRLRTNKEQGFEAFFSPTKANQVLDYTSGIHDIGLTMDFDYYHNSNHHIKFGGNVVYHTFQPGNFHLKNLTEGSFGQQLLDTIVRQDVETPLAFYAYLQNDWKVTKAIRVNYGVHFSSYHLTDQTYWSLQPRISLRYLMPNQWAVKASFAQMRQYLQLLTNEGLGLPTDLWLPSTARIKPQDGWQVATGVAKSLKQDYEFSAELFYKEMNNIVAFKPGSGLFQLDDWQGRITQGLGTAYGLECFLQRKRGHLNGWIGYTLSWAWRQFEEGLSSSIRYPYRYDRRHDLSIVGNYEVKKGINISAIWVYSSGNYASIPNAAYTISIPDIITAAGVDYYENRNNTQLKPNHRLDLSIRFTKQKRLFIRTWSFGTYNTYNRKNPFYVQSWIEEGLNDEGESILYRTYRQTSLLPLIPFITYKIEF